MKMSEESYKILTDFYNLTVETANDNEVRFIMSAIRNAATTKKMEMDGVKKEDINYDNPNMDKHNAKVIRDFFEDFLKTASNDEAIYLIEGLSALVKNYVDHPEEVAKFVISKKEEVKKNAEKKD